MKRLRPKISAVSHAGGKTSFWPARLMRGIRFRAKASASLLWAKRKTFFCFWLSNCTKTKRSCVLSHTVSYAVSGSYQTTGDMLKRAYGGVEPAIIELDRSSPGNSPICRSLQGSSDCQIARAASGIHAGIALCTAVKDRFKHTLEASLRVDFTNKFPIKHGKKSCELKKVRSLFAFAGVL